MISVQDKLEYPFSRTSYAQENKYFGGHVLHALQNAANPNSRLIKLELNYFIKYENHQPYGHNSECSPRNFRSDRGFLMSRLQPKI